MTDILNNNPVYIIGDSPLAILLSAKLTLAGENILLLGADKILKKNTPLTFKDETTGLKRTVQIQTTSLMRETALVVILCSLLPSFKANLTYFSKQKTGSAPILSFCPKNYIEKTNMFIGQELIYAYFDGWLKQGFDNSIHYLGCNNGLTVSLSENNPHALLISALLEQTELKINFNKNDEQNFWNNFIFYTTCSLFSLQEGAHLRDIAKKAQYRQTLNEILDELLTICPQEFKIEKEVIINNIYQTPSGYKYPVIKDNELQAHAELSYMREIVEAQNNYKATDFPIISTIFKQHL